MSFYLEFQTDDADFDGDHIRIAVPYVLKNVAQVVAFGGNVGKVRDAAGNQIGRWELDHPEDEED